MIRVVLVSDPYHSARIKAIADEVGLDAVTSPTRPVRSKVRPSCAGSAETLRSRPAASSATGASSASEVEKLVRAWLC